MAYIQLNYSGYEKYEEKKEIIARIKLLENNNSAAVRNRVSKALNILKNGAPLPKGLSKI